MEKIILKFALCSFEGIKIQMKIIVNTDKVLIRK